MAVKKTYDPLNVLVSLGSSFLGGLAESFIEIEFDEDSYTKMTGAGGETTRTRNRNKGAKITVRVLQDSSANDTLHALWLLDQQSNAGTVPFQMQELGGTTIATAPYVWVSKPPVIKRGKEAAEVEWVLDTDSMEVTLGGLIGL